MFLIVTDIVVHLTNVLIGSRYTYPSSVSIFPHTTIHRNKKLTSIVQYGLLVPSQFFLSCKPDGTSISSHTVSNPASNRSISATCHHTLAPLHHPLPPTYLRINIIANLPIRTKSIIPSKHAIPRQQVDHILGEKLPERSVILGERVVVNSI